MYLFLRLDKERRIKSNSLNFFWKKLYCLEIILKKKSVDLFLPFSIGEQRTMFGPSYTATCCSAELCIMNSLIGYIGCIV
jgi:hypothetical protein